jgi:5-methyltetrahydropteroyltriglutamate--homocysteine methyltransferase
MGNYTYQVNVSADHGAQHCIDHHAGAKTGFLTQNGRKQRRAGAKKWMVDCIGGPAEYRCGSLLGGGDAAWGAPSSDCQSGRLCLQRPRQVAPPPGGYMHQPPFRADHVGSFLRPPRLLEAREKFFVGTVNADELRAIEDECILEVVEHQERAGLNGVTDGEFRRTYFHIDFLERLAGVHTHYGEFVAKFRKDDGSEVGFKPPTMHVESKIAHAAPIQGADFDFLKSVTSKTPKVCIPAPSMLHFRGGRDAISAGVYPQLEDFYDDLTAAYRAEIADLAARGCRYLQFDDTNLAYLCDPAIRERTKARGDNPDDLARLYCKLVNDSIRGRPKDMTISVHLCRGNFKSAWVAQGGYEPVAEILLNEMKIEGFFLEYDDERSGDFAPLRFTPKGVTIVLGLMSSKHAAAEGKDEVKRRIDEAARYVPLEQCALSHQCGFSSTAHGNDLTDADQWIKLARLVEIAKDVWADA